MRYTVISDYCGTGEGRTVTVYYVMAETEEDAMKSFKLMTYGGDFFCLCAEVTEGWDFDSAYARLLISPGVQKQLEDPLCHQSFTATIHFNYS